MRMWHKDLLEVLPNYQLRGQWRELKAILGMWKKKGTPNNILINNVLDYSKNDFTNYVLNYVGIVNSKKVLNIKEDQVKDFLNFQTEDFFKNDNIFCNWHNKAYLRVCMANLYEKHFYAKGRSRISDEDWNNLIKQYKKLTNEDYCI